MVRRSRFDQLAEPICEQCFFCRVAKFLHGGPDFIWIVALAHTFDLLPRYIGNRRGDSKAILEDRVKLRAFGFDTGTVTDNFSGFIIFAEDEHPVARQVTGDEWSMRCE